MNGMGQCIIKLGCGITSKVGFGGGWGHGFGRRREERVREGKDRAQGN